MKFIYNFAKTFKKPLVITDAIGADKIKLYGNKIEVYMSDEFISDFFDKPVEEITANDVIDYAEGGLPDILIDAFHDHKIDFNINDLSFDTIEL